MQRYATAFYVLCLTCLTSHFLPAKGATRPFYPIGIYSVKTTNDYATVKAAGFNLVVGQADQACLDAARAAGLKMLAAPNTSAGPNFNPAAARQAVRDYDQHPALWAWYLVDEPDFNEVPPAQVAEAHRCLKAVRARKPTALVLYQGYEALHYANLADITLIDRYPIPWLPLANFGQHITLARLAVAKDRPLIAVIQAFDWSAYPEMLPGEKNLRPPTYAELRCMTYEALARGANGLFFYAFDSGKWQLREHPETWTAVQAVIKEVNERLPLFQARPQWWPKNHRFADPAHRFNAALESSVTSTLLRVCGGDHRVPDGDYVLAVNNTERPQTYSFALPPEARNGGESKAGESRKQKSTPALGEGRTLEPDRNRIQDQFAPFAVHVYGPLP